ncbi:Arylsulphatase [Neofusicoccum parvum]|nr:Arylsulphatase [Neofusicoccum parvum]
MVQKYMGEQGTYYRRHYCTIAICCPSRVSLLTGKHAHNTNVTDVSPPYGGYPKFISQGLNDEYLPVWLQEAGYNTYYTGKLMNAHSTSNYDNPFPKGWTAHDFLIDPGTYKYWNATFQRNTSPPTSFPNEYNTDLVADRALAFLTDAHAASRPFFLGIAPIGPHADTLYPAGATTPIFTIPKPATRHAAAFPNASVPRSPNFNPAAPSLANWIAALPPLNASETAFADAWFRARLQALQAVDELVGRVVERLEELGVGDETFVFYTSDNGFHVGQHRLQPGKSCPVEEDVNVPFFVRGPGVARGEVVERVTTHTDVAPTLFELAGVPLRADFDGEPIPVVAGRGGADGGRREHVNVEYWGPALIGEGMYSPSIAEAADGAYGNNTYKALRIVGESYSFFYTIWCSNEHELYDMESDPGQMHNLLANGTQQPSGLFLGRPVQQLQPRLDALLMVLKSCKSDSCRLPWDSLHPNGTVSVLSDAMNPKYDAFYARQPKIEFSRCEFGYILDAEGPQNVEPYRNGGQENTM